MTQSLSDYARAVPYLAVSAHGLGPSFVFGSDPAQQLASLRDSREGVWGALETAGVTGRRLLQVLATLGGGATSQQIDFQTQSAEATVISAALGRLAAARLIERGTDGSVKLPERVAPFLPNATISMADQDAITSEKLAHICKALGLKAPTRKQERIDTISGVFADPTTSSGILGDISPTAVALLDQIADIVGIGVATPDQLDLTRFSLRTLDSTYYAHHHSAEEPRAQALTELVSRGIVGVSGWDYQLWIWRESWPLLGRPLFTDWQTPPEPLVEPVETAPVRVPKIVGVLDHALQAWQASPPSVLKNGDRRLAKTDLRKLAKSLGTEISTADVVSRLAIGIGLLLTNTVSESGRGRNRTFEQAWMPDPQLTAEWSNLAPMERWLGLVAEWSQPSQGISEQLLVNRHLLLWELAKLPPDTGWADTDQFAAWFAHHYARLGDSTLVIECIKDLRALGVANPTGPLAITSLAAIALADPVAAAAIDVGNSTSAIVQADHTVIAPPDLQADIASRLATIAAIESDAGAFVYRLEAELITRAVQAGDDADSIIDFLAQLSSVALPNNVEWLVRDSAKLANRVKVISAPTVVVVSDPADLILACSVKAAKLTAISDTVAVTDLPHAKIRTVLDRKGLTPEVVLGGSAQPPRTQANEERIGYRSTDRGIERVVIKGPSIEEIAARFRVVGPLAVTPTLVAQLDPSTSS